LNLLVLTVINTVSALDKAAKEAEKQAQENTFVAAPAGMEPGALYEVNLDDGDHTVRYKGDVLNKAALPAHPKLDDEYWVNRPGNYYISTRVGGAAATWVDP